MHRFPALAMAALAVATSAALALTGAAATRAQAADDPEAQLFQPAGGLTLDDFRWQKRLAVVFADTEADPRFRRQMEALEDRPDELRLRDMVVIFDTDPSARTPLRRELRPRGFMLVLIGKDGEVKLRKPEPWDVREISRSVDKWPLRQQEQADLERARHREVYGR